MSATKQYGSLIYIVNEPQPVQSDEESTEFVMQRKPVNVPNRSIIEEGVWWQEMNHEFALDNDDEYCPAVPAARQAVPKSTSSTPQLSDDEWMELNQGFALDRGSDVEMEVEERVAKKPARVMNYGDYGIWD